MKSTRSLDALVLPVRLDALELHRLARDADLALQQLDTYRDPWDQARFYRQSRTRAEIVAKQAQLEARGFPYLSTIIDQVGPQQGTLEAHVTYAGPGESWHQFGEALDACPYMGDPGNSPLAWAIGPKHADYEKAQRRWQLYRAICQRFDLREIGAWDGPHAQRRAGHPLDVLTADEVNAWAVAHGWPSPTTPSIRSP